METNIKVSIVIPVFNTEPSYIDEALQSVCQQTLNDIEIIIVDDGSTDAETLNYLKTIKNPYIKLIHQENSGSSIARNTGIRIARGKYILPLDSDDKISPDYCKIATDILDKNPDIAVVYSEAEFFGKKRKKWILEPYSLNAIKINNMVFATAFYRKSDWESVGGYKAYMKYGIEDWDFWLYFAERGKKFYKIPETMFFYRMHSKKSVSKNLSISLYKVRYSKIQMLMHHPTLYSNIDDAMELLYPKSALKNLSLLEKIFSLKNSKNKLHKIITILGIQIKVKRNSCKDKINKQVEEVFYE